MTIKERALAMQNEDAGMTLRQIANELNVSYQYVSQIFKSAGFRPRAGGRPKGGKSVHPLFDPQMFGKSVTASDWLLTLARRTGYSHTYLVRIKNGTQRANLTMRRRIAASLRRKESELFSELFSESEEIE